jgi:hypothetical protein
MKFTTSFNKYFIFMPLLLTACAGVTDPKISYDRQNITYPSIESFSVCRSYGCEIIDTESLSNRDISNIKNIFKTNSNEDIEKKNIKKHIAYMEREIGDRTGTSEDVGGTYVKLGHNQQDCVDESTNTTTYLLLAEQLGLLKFHRVNALTSRPPVLSGRLGPHRTAVIVDKDTGDKYAVDSWFHDNGIEPEIVKLDKWRWGWHPKSHD